MRQRERWRERETSMRERKVDWLPLNVDQITLEWESTLSGPQILCILSTTPTLFMSVLCHSYRSWWQKLPDVIWLRNYVYLDFFYEGCSRVDVIVQHKHHTLCTFFHAHLHGYSLNLLVTKLSIFFFSGHSSTCKAIHQWPWIRVESYHRSLLFPHKLDWFPHWSFRRTNWFSCPFFKTAAIQCTN